MRGKYAVVCLRLGLSILEPGMCIFTPWRLQLPSPLRHI